MAALAATIAETVAGMQRTITKDQYFSDSDEPYLQPSNYGNKLKRQANLMSGGLDERVKAGRKAIKHAGYTRDILRRNPKRYDEDGDELATEDEDEEATARAAEENPYADIKLESLLAPLTSAASLPEHPSLSVSYTSSTLGDMADYARKIVQRERRTLANAKRMLTKLRGDDTWILPGQLEADYDNAIFDVNGVYDMILASSPINGGHRKTQSKLNGDFGDKHHHSGTGAEASTILAPNASKTQQNSFTTETAENRDTAREGEVDSLAAHDKQDSSEGMHTTSRHYVKPEGKENGGSSLESPRIVEQTPFISQHSTLDGGPNSKSRQPSTMEIDENTVLPSVENTQPYDPPPNNDGNEDQPNEGKDDAATGSKSPPRRITRAQAQADKVTASSHSESPSDWVSPPIHPLFLIPPTAEPEADFGLPSTEAAETRHLLAAYVQKQEEVCRGAEKLYEGLLLADRQRKTVYNWCKAEAHIGEMSDGEDWYDKEEWGLEEDLRKGHAEEEEDPAVQGKKTRGRRA